MTVNRAELSLQKRPQQVIHHLQREQRAIKTRQLLGGDNSVFAATTTSMVSIPDVPAGGWQHVLNVAVNPTLDKLMMAEVAYTVYLDTDNDPTRVWPQGSALTNDEIFNIEVDFRRELYNANNATGDYQYTFRFINNSAAVHDFFIRLSLIFQKVSVS